LSLRLPLRLLLPLRLPLLPLLPLPLLRWLLRCAQCLQKLVDVDSQIK
jgi:hypothetical protein